MSKLGRPVGTVVFAAAALAGCMTGRPSLLATQGGGGDADSEPSTSSSPTTRSPLLGPSRGMASSGNVSPAALGSSSARRTSGATAALRISSGLTSLQAAANLTAPIPSSGRTARVSGAVAANTRTIAAAGQTSLAITPTLAPASSVGASVAAVSQPLNVAAGARASASTGSKTSAAANVKLKAAGVGVSVHVGP